VIKGPSNVQTYKTSSVYAMIRVWKFQKYFNISDVRMLFKRY